MKKLEAVIFDMDGVLFDTERMSCECCFEAAKQLGLTLAEEAVYGGCGRNEASLRRHIMETEEPWYPNGTFPYEKYRERFMALFQESLVNLRSAYSFDVFTKSIDRGKLRPKSL